MRVRLLAAALVAVAAGSVGSPAAADPLLFERECSGKVDSRCYHDFCGIVSCIRSDCLVYSGLTGSGNGAICVGKSRPGDPVE